jgi:D-alanyl-lipoteichoic acid acyltransferase DltB (MBOAT superfamily)
MPAFQQILMSHADNPLVLAVLVSFVVGICVRLFRFLRRVDALSLIGLLCSVVILGHGAGWLYFNALVLYGIVSVIGKINSELGRTVAFQSLLTGIAFLFIANSYFGFGEVGLAFPILQMILFLKFLVFIWEVSTGRIQSMPLMAYLAWTGLPFTDIYLRPSEFMAQTESGRVSPKPLGKPFIADTLVRLLMLLCAVGIEWMAECLASQNHLLVRLFQVFLSGPWGFYLHAAGCSGLLRNAGAIAGFTVPENFKSPFLATNISDFWSRWNIGATRAFRHSFF